MTENTILVVDDDPNSLDIVRTYLRAHGYRVYTARDGQEALHVLAEAQPALVLLDVMMPGMDGWEVARQIKSQPEHAGIRVVMLTARSDYGERYAEQRAAADDYLVKPIRLTELGERVRRNLQAIDPH